MRLLPRSLLGRVWALYAGTLVAMVGLGLGLFVAGELARQVDRSRADAKALVNLVLPTLADSAVIGDYDAIQRQLQRLSALSLVDSAEFRDRKGGHLDSRDLALPDAWPGWLQHALASRLDAPVEPVVAGGTRYGELRLKLSAAPVATALVRQTGVACGVALAGLAAGLLLVRRPLKRWLGDLDRIAGLDLAEAGGRLAGAALAQDAPAEFRRTYEVLDRAATRLQAAREQAAVTLQAIDDAVFTCNVEGQVLLANEAAQRLLGRGQDSLAGEHLHRLLPALARAPAVDPAQPGWRHHEVEWIAPTGRRHVLDANLSPVRDAAGAVVGLVLACHDITPLRLREAALADAHAARDAALRALRQVLEGAPQAGAASRAVDSDIEAVSGLVSELVVQLQRRTAELDAIFDLSPDGFVGFGDEGRVQYASPGFVQLTGLDRAAVLGLDAAAFQARLQACSATPEAWPGLVRAEQAEGTLVEFTHPARRVLALRMHRGNSAGRLLHLRDVTRETEVDRMKSEFIAAAAHELRTPMVGIYGYAELLCSRELAPPRQKDLLGRIYRQCEVMVRILNDMLDLSRLEAGHGVGFAPLPMELGGWVAQALTAFAPPPDREPPLWRAPERPLAVRADAVQLQRVLGNLLSNAYKYSPAGGDVVVSVQVDAAGRCAGLAVRDHGIGLTADQAARVGERFYRADDSGSVPGTGLGVSLVREIAALHRGHLELHSEPGQGTTVTLWLPLSEPAAPAAVETAAGQPVLA